MPFTVYTAKNERGECLYVGGTFQNSPSKRWHQHYHKARTGSRSPLHKALADGSVEFSVITTYPDMDRRNKDDQTKAKHLEGFWVEFLGTHMKHGGLNVVPAGNGFVGNERQLTLEQEQQAIKDYQSGKTMAEVGMLFGVHAATIRNTLTRHGVAARPKWHGAKGRKIPSRRVLTKAEGIEALILYEGGLTTRDIARKFSVSQTCVYDLLEEKGVALRRRGPRKLLTADKIQTGVAMRKAGMLYKDIAKRLGASENTTQRCISEAL